MKNKYSLEDNEYEAMNKIKSRFSQTTHEYMEKTRRSQISYDDVYERCAYAMIKIIKEMNPYAYNQAIEVSRNKLGMKWDNNRQRLSFYEEFNNYLPVWMQREMK